MEKPLWMWLVFLLIIVCLLLLDLGVFHKRSKEVGIKESLRMSGFYITVGILFGFWVWYKSGIQDFAEYLTGFLVEKSLSVDNIFLISIIFSGLSVPKQYQYRVLFWGILGVIVLRGIMIALGVQLLAHFYWILYVFALFLVFTGIKMLWLPKQNIDLDKNKILIWLRKHLRITSGFHGQRFYIREIDPASGRRITSVTPLFVALILIELTDLVFAVDSIPAIFTITQDPYIVYTSNIFAILGLRALYFALAAIIDRFYYLKFALAGVLIFIGSKIFIADAMGWEKFPPLVSLAITFGLLLSGCLYSVYKLKSNQSGDHI